MNVQRGIKDRWWRVVDNVGVPWFWLRYREGASHWYSCIYPNNSCTDQTWANIEQTMNAKALKSNQCWLIFGENRGR
jgi:hypothetical protein